MKNVPRIFLLMFFLFETTYSITIYVTPSTPSSSSTLQGIIDNQGTGNTIFLQNGTYSLSVPITISNKNNMVIVGQSKNVIIQFLSANTQLKNLITIGNSQNIVLKNIHFIGTNIDCPMMTVNGKEVPNDGNINIGVYIINASTNITISECEFEKNFTHGIYAGDNVSNSNFSNNYFHGRIFVSGITLNWKDCGYNKTTKNIMDFSYRNCPMGIWLGNGTHHNTIDSNTIKGCSAEGIVSEGGAPNDDPPPSPRNSICANTVTDCSYGIVFRCQTYGFVHGNFIQNCPTVGIQFMPENSSNYIVTNCIASNNTIIDCGTSLDQGAVIIGTSESNTIIGNIIQYTNYGIKVINAQNCSIVGNTIFSKTPSVGKAISADSSVLELNNSEFQSSFIFNILQSN